ncbi:MAG: hypothetical protein HY904_16140 [Deltaproteobacteria bacterium]|nr:hypothetical protein [Deltaproteobacteria bacterium]
MTTGDAFWTLDPFAVVQPGDPWFVDIERGFDPSRYGLAAKLRRHFAPAANRREFVHLGVVGHRGTGKTTQLRRAAKDFSTWGIEPVFIDTLATLDQDSLTFADILLVISRSVLEKLRDLSVNLPTTEQKLLEQWFAEEVLTETHSKEFVGSVETEASAKGGVPFLAALTAKITAVLKSNNEYRTEIRKRADRDPADLVRRLT